MELWLLILTILNLIIIGLLLFILIDISEAKKELLQKSDKLKGQIINRIEKEIVRSKEIIELNIKVVKNNLERLIK